MDLAEPSLWKTTIGSYGDGASDGPDQLVSYLTMPCMRAMPHMLGQMSIEGENMSAGTEQLNDWQSSDTGQARACTKVHKRIRNILTKSTQDASSRAVPR